MTFYSSYGYISPKTIVCFEVGKENYEDFCEWAFGKGFSEKTKVIKIPEVWNSLHPDHPISGKNDYKKDLHMMIELWRKESGKNKS